MKWLPLLVLLFVPAAAWAQLGGANAFGRVQLNDVNIQGEANSDSMRFSQRDIADITKRLHVRTNFVDRIEELAPRDWKKDESKTK